MPFTSDREALQHLADTITRHELHDLDRESRQALDAVCCHLLGPDPAHARLRRSLCETAALADHLDRRLLTLAGEPYNHPRGEVQRARIVLQETAK